MSLSKIEVRKEILPIRRAIPTDRLTRASAAITSQIIDRIDIDKYDEYLLFYPLPHEISLLPLAKQLLMVGKNIAFPRVHGETMDFYQVTSLKHDFQEGSFHVMEPQTNNKANLKNTICFVPGLVFDRNFYRLGYGRGYYDRYLGAHPGLVTVGVCSDRFFMPEVPKDEHDIPLDMIVTETNLYVNDHHAQGKEIG